MDNEPTGSHHPTDALTAVIANYLQAVDKGFTPDREALLAHFPHLAVELRAFFAAQQQLERLGLPLCPRGATVNMAGVQASPATVGTRPSNSAPAPSSVPGVVGDHEILGELGRGGMGVVYKARQTRLGRLVALKMVLAGCHAGPAELARFKTEAEAIARLQHPNIVQVHEVGEHNGLPYFSLEYCAGGSLAQKLEGTPLPPKEAAALVETLARAVHAAHEKGVVHRDLKPANVLLAEDGTPKVTDFGLAKKLDEAGQTQSGAIMGTPSYMAPEQAAGNARQVGPAADVYALGTVLYECLTGRPPFRAATPLDTVLQVLSAEPVAPSQLNAKVPVDLDTICLKSLQKEPGMRYASAAELAEDLRRFQVGEPIAARPVGRAERLWRWCRRNPVLAAVSGLAAVGLTAAAVVAVSFGIYQGRAAADLRAEQRLTKAALTDAEIQRDQAKARLAENHLDRALVACELEDDAALGMVWLTRALEAAPSGEATLDRLIRTNLAAYRRRVPALKAILAPPEVVLAVAFSSDGKTILSHCADRQPRMWEAATGRPLTLPLPQTGKDGVRILAVSPDGKAVLALTADNTLRLWEAATGRPLTPRFRHEAKREVHTAVFRPDSKAVLTVSYDGTGRLWDAATGTSLSSPLKLKGDGRAVAFRPDGKIILSGGFDGTAELCDAVTGRPRTPSIRHSQWQTLVEAVAFSPDGKAVLTGATDSMARLWDAATGQPTTPPLRHQGHVNAVAFSPDGRILVTGSRDRTARLWDAATGRPLSPPLRHDGRVFAVAFSPDGRTFVTASRDRTARLWDVAAVPSLLAPLPKQPDAVRTVWRPNGKAVFTSPNADPAQRWELPLGRPLIDELVRDRQQLSVVAFGREGKAVLIHSRDGTARVREAATGRALSPPLLLKNGLGLLTDPFELSAAFSPDGKTLVTGGTPDGTVHRWEVTTGRPLGPPLRHMDRSQVITIACSPDGKILVTGGTDGTAQRWEADTGRSLAPPLRHQGYVSAVAFSPDGKTVLTGSYDNTAQLWDAATGRPLSLPLRHQDVVYAVAFSPDGKAVVTGSGDHRVGLWDAATGRPLAPPFRGGGGIKAAAFSPDGKAIFAAGWSLPTQRWDVPVPVAGPTARVRLWLQVLTGTEVDDAGTVRVLDAGAWQASRQQLAQRGGPPGG
jgi:WD40 repeat protein